MRIIVVGAGIVGASAAYHLSKKGADVVLVDKFHEGQATAAGAGIVCPWISRVEDQDWYTFAKGGACYYPNLVSQLKEDGEHEFGYRVVGALAVSNDEDELNRIEDKVRKRQAETPAVGEVTRLSPEEARNMFPPLRANLGAVYVTGAARVDGRLLRDAMKRAAQKHGVVHQAGEAKLEVADGKVTGVKVNDEFLSADAVVIAAGAWASELLQPFGISIPVEPQKGQIVHLTLPGQDTSNWPVVLPQSSHYLVSFDDRVVVGATRETGSGFDYRVTAAGLKEVLDEALSVAPGLSDSTLHDIRIGFRPAGPDYLPLFGHVPSIDGVVVATGLGASGLTIGPYIGKLAAQLALNEEVEVDISPCNPFRNSVNV
ncbi:NAD(P)/FAD-dependent oxidoreductase [Bacillus litorisediminis]|uniref:NAD(P)/FAD-dependent oxidoreductase n=1 Tax=Bacillus litorisediminis TaxID=2922713 RepID=UPI001FAE1069|nr:FAD-dependent oxidoreductase [Bacillus litorisediminis]